MARFVSSLPQETLADALASTVFFPPARWALRRFGPGPGEGPSLDQQKNGWFKVATTAKSVDKTQEVQVVMRGKGDPVRSPVASSPAVNTDTLANS